MTRRKSIKAVFLDTPPPSQPQSGLILVFDTVECTELQALREPAIRRTFAELQQ